MIRSIIWYFKFIFLLLINYKKVKKTEQFLKNGELEKFDEYRFEKTGKWAMGRIKDSGSSIDIKGIENIPKSENVVFISNHQSDFDIAIFMAMIPKHKGFVAKIELDKIPILRKWLEYTDSVLIDRKNLRQSLDAINKAVEVVKNKHSMVIFPEGTRSKGDKMGEFKAGSFKLAIKSNAPIVPVSIDGSYKIKEKNKGFIRPANVDVYIHKPIYLRDIDAKSLPKMVQQIISTKLSYYKNNINQIY